MARRSQNIPVHHVSKSNFKIFLNYMHSDVQHTAELCLILFHHHCDYHGLHLKSTTLTFHSVVFNNIEYAEDWNAK